MSSVLASLNQRLITTLGVGNICQLTSLPVNSTTARRISNTQRSRNGKTPKIVAMASSMPSDALGRSASRDEEGNGSDQSPATEGNGDSVAQAAGATSANSSVPKPKRLACMICRKRKLKCDGVKPSCSTCTRLGHTCAYDEVRRKSGPKRGYVKALEERLSEHHPISSILLLFGGWLVNHVPLQL